MGGTETASPYEPSDLQRQGINTFSSHLFQLSNTVDRAYDEDTLTLDAKQGEDDRLPMYNNESEDEDIFTSRTQNSIPPLGRQSSKNSTPRRKALHFHHEEHEAKRAFVLKLTKALLLTGSPSHRVESQLTDLCQTIGLKATFVHLPTIVIITLGNTEYASRETVFIRGKGHVNLSGLQDIHAIYTQVMRRDLSITEGSAMLDEILKFRKSRSNSVLVRCFLAFTASCVLCIASFGGSVLDMCIAGISATFLEYMNAAIIKDSVVFAGVFEITTSILISGVARALASVPNNLFCYEAISLSGIIQLIPGFTILASTLELASRNLVCGSVQIVFSIIYTLILGFGLTVGSDIFLVLYPKGRATVNLNPDALNYFHGIWTATNGTQSGVPILADFAYQGNATMTIIKGCFRSADSPWYTKNVPNWVSYLVVPIYALCIALLNSQNIKRTSRLSIMVLFACCAHFVTSIGTTYIPGQSAIVSWLGAFTIGTLGTLYARATRGPAFAVMVPSMLFIVPSSLAYGAAGSADGYTNSLDASSFTLSRNMVMVAVGVALGIFMSQILVTLYDSCKNKFTKSKGIHFAL